MERNVLQLLLQPSVIIVTTGIVLLATNGCGAHECTEIGCSDQATITIQRHDGVKPNLALNLEIDGEQFQCPPLTNDYQSCGPLVTTMLQEVQDCQEQRNGSTVSLQCRGTGAFEQVVTINDTPQHIKLTAKYEGTTINHVIEPVYKDAQPNGAGCEPICRQASEVWHLP